MKKFISVILSVIMLAGTISADAAEGHGDLAAPSSWAREEISTAEKIGMLDKFKVPWTNAVTRAQFCILAYNMLDAAMDIEWKKVSPNPFEDTDNEKVIALRLEGIIEGKDEGIFAPGDSITREEAAVILYRIAQYAGAQTDLPHNDIAYIDDADISQWAREAVYELYYLGVMKGTDNGFEPKKNYTVEQSVATLMRLYRLMDISMSFADKMNEQMPEDKNYMFSPLSIKIALAMAANGAEENSGTRKEILSALDIDDLQEYNEQVKNMIENYSASDFLKLNISNSAWINKDNTERNFDKDYEDLIKNIFGAQVGTVTKDTALSEINGWVNDKTEGKIPAIIGEDNTDFWAMLVNAVYFKGRWLNEFNPAATEEDIFTDRNGKESNIDFMNRTAWMNYSETEGVQIVKLPYLNRKDNIDENGEYTDTQILDMDISMYLMMSENEFNPEELLNKAELSSRYISLSMPKFSVEYSANINEMLRNIGINKAFGQSAEFGKMFDSGNMSITDVIHKTYIKTDEEGTEAAAVTSLGMAGSSLPPEPLKVRFNKPFTFVIRDDKNGEILFMGEYAFAE